MVKQDLQALVVVHQAKRDTGASLAEWAKLHIRTDARDEDHADRCARGEAVDHGPYAAYHEVGDFTCPLCDDTIAPIMAMQQMHAEGDYDGLDAALTEQMKFAPHAAEVAVILRLVDHLDVALGKKKVA